MDVQLEQPATTPAARWWRPRRAVLLAAAAVVWLALAILVPGPALVAWAFGEAPKLLLLAALVVALWVIPGLALLRLLAPDAALGTGSRLAMSLGCGIALPPLLLELASLVGLPWNRRTTIAYLAVALAFLVWSYRHAARAEARRTGRLSLFASRFSPLPALLLGLLGLGFVLRIFLMRDLPAGMWGDSYHHTMIAQLLVDNGGLFRSWEPYAPLTTFTYHFGFHANVAFFHWLTGVRVARSLLYTGQLVNWATLPAAYLLTRRLGGSRWAAITAVLLIGFVNRQPLFYINWGRYTQLDGQAVLPALFVAWMLLLEAPVRGMGREARGNGRTGLHLAPLRLALLAALLTASMMLTHYLVTLFAALLVGAYLVIMFAVRWPAWRGQEGSAARAHKWDGIMIPSRIAGRALLVVGLALLLAAPWLANTLGGYLLRNVAASSGASSSTSVAPAGLAPIDSGAVMPVLLGLAVLGAVFALARREWRVGMLAVWALLLIGVTQPYVLGLPGTGVVTTLAAYIALYLPLLPLAAYALATPLEALARRSNVLAVGIATVAVFGLSVWGLRWQQYAVDPYFQHFRPADARAMQWIRDNTAPGDRFLVNMLPAYNETLLVGTDGGWWIPLLAGRQTSLPPVTYGSERSSIPEFSKQVREFGFATRDYPPASEEGIGLLRDAGIRYVYIGAHQAPVTDNVIDVAALRASPDYEVAYEADGVVIFRMRR